jgi:hypothetical protein
MLNISIAVTGIGLIIVQYQADVHANIFVTVVARWIQPWLACSLVTTGLCTSEHQSARVRIYADSAFFVVAIIYRLVSIHLRFPSGSNVYSPSRSLLLSALRIFIESAALYSLVNLLYIALYSANLAEVAWFSNLVNLQRFYFRIWLSHALYSSQEPQIASITFSLIIIRLESPVKTSTIRLSDLATYQIQSPQPSTV